MQQRFQVVRGTRVLIGMLPSGLGLTGTSPLTLAQWGEALRRAGFTPMHLEATHNPWIISNRYEGTVRLTDLAGKPLPWPATNGVIVGQKG